MIRKKFNANAHWLLFGTGEKYMDVSQQKDSSKETIEEIFSRLKNLEQEVSSMKKGE